VLTRNHLGPEEAFSSLLARDSLDAYISSRPCCMPATILASVDLNTVHSMRPFIITTRFILIDFPTFISSCSGRDGRGKVHV